MFGESIPNLRRRRDIRSRIGIQFQEDSLYNDIRVKEALRLYASMYQNPVDPDELIDIFELQRQQKNSLQRLIRRRKAQAAHRHCLSGQTGAADPR